MVCSGTSCRWRSVHASRSISLKSPLLQGPERVKNLYAFRSIVDAGARITLGSDFPVEDINPLAGFHAAVTRLSPDNRSPHGVGGW